MHIFIDESMSLNKVNNDYFSISLVIVSDDNLSKTKKFI